MPKLKAPAPMKGAGEAAPLSHCSQAQRALKGSLGKSKVLGFQRLCANETVLTGREAKEH